MAPVLKPVRGDFIGEITGFDTGRKLSAEDVKFVTDAIHRYAVLVFRDQPLDDDQQIDFTSQLGELHVSIASNRTDLERRVRSDLVSDISNVGADGGILSPDDRRRIQQRANLLWHTDNSFRHPAGAFTLLNARIVPPEAGETEFADTRAAFDALPKAEQERLEKLTAIHCLANSRRLAGTAGYFDAVEAERFPPTEQPLIRLHEGSGRKALYIGSHAQEIAGMSREDGEALLNELLDFATQPQFVYRHTWRVGDLVMWDNRATLHRALPFDETKYRRDLRRTATTAQGQRGPALVD
jgi:alpha-ketoglutarate-dependent 2,4-dichlorophenoxyacetate dioxygenase